MDKKFNLEAIGQVEADEQGFSLRIYQPFRKALSGLHGYSHIQVYWWADQCDNKPMRRQTTSFKPYKKGPDEIGIFATRSPMRPNPVAMTVVPLLLVDQEQGILRIPYIDAEVGTPLLDIKPYYGMERVKVYHIPEWCRHWPEWYEDAGSFDWAGEFENAH